MRISDWSSDVCSSDLLVLKRCADAEDIVIAADHPDAAAGFQDALRFLEPRMREAVVGGEAVEFVPIIVDGVDLAAVWTMQVAAERSEEHTSELQSLMRISYAVFCLKKKNKQNS